MTKNRTVSFISLTLIFLGFLLLPSFLSAQIYDNFGFRKDVPEEIRKAFPMCDEFLDVKWIDEKRNIGKLKTEWYKNGKKEGFLYLLVKLENPGSEYMLRRGDGIIYGISEQEYYSKEFENIIKEAEYTYGKGFFFMYARKDKKTKKFSQERIPFAHPSENYTKSYAGFSKTICILYPNKEYAFFVETNLPFLKDNLSDNLNQKYDSILRYAKEKCSNYSDYRCYLKHLRYSEAIDVNFDGLDDYIFKFWVQSESKGKVFILFSKPNKFEIKDITNCIYHVNAFYGARDKKAVFFGRCDLTELTKGGN